APFVGAHSDIGGGSFRAEDGQAITRGDLADVALNWMLWQASAASVVFDPLPVDDQEVTQAILHDQRPALQRSVQNGDRSVKNAYGYSQYGYQDEHPQFG